MPEKIKITERFIIYPRGMFFAFIANSDIYGWIQFWDALKH